MKKEGGRVKKEPLNAIEGKENEHLKKSIKSKKSKKNVHGTSITIYYTYKSPVYVGM